MPGKRPRVRELLEFYKKSGLSGVSLYLNSDLEIDPDTWVGKQKKLLDNKNYGSMEAEIASVLFIMELGTDKNK